MGAAPVSLDQGPPLPQQLQPQPSMQQLAGPQNGQQQQSGSASLTAQVAQKAMFVEQTINDLVQMLPSLQGQASSWIDTFRKSLSSALAKGPAPSQGPMGGSSSLLMNSPTGGSGAAPTS